VRCATPPTGTPTCRTLTNTLGCTAKFGAMPWAICAWTCRGGQTAGLNSPGKGEVHAAIRQNQNFAVEVRILDHLDGQNVARTDPVAILCHGLGGDEYGRHQRPDCQNDLFHRSHPVVCYPLTAGFSQISKVVFPSFAR
jgi:hypothetical protein